VTKSLDLHKRVLDGVVRDLLDPIVSVVTIDVCVVIIDGHTIYIFILFLIDQRFLIFMFLTPRY